MTTVPPIGDVNDAIDIIALIIAVGFPIIGSCVLAWLASKQAQDRKRQDLDRDRIAELEARIAAVEKDRDDIKHLFRVAIIHIREWMTWSREHHPGTPPPAMPDELRNEV
ncbi:hypothetical protein [Gordonia sp. (in: high G+C Gram-positive bacteria)]|uniref:hypothetical protein n=1 Tax=Gordonia sp. (in: high G+C Gram-positive bacteria) TaxID=84139 RepID=UPI0039E4CF3E